MAQRNLKASVRTDANVLSFARPSGQDCGTTALNFVYQAAEVFSSMEDHARETEAHAQSMCKSAAERLKHAEKRIEAAERVRRELIPEAECKLQEVSRALKQAQSRIEAAEDSLTAMEFRAQAAEAEASEAKQALALVEEARGRLIRWIIAPCSRRALWARANARLPFSMDPIILVRSRTCSVALPLRSSEKPKPSRRLDRDGE